MKRSQFLKIFVVGLCITLPFTNCDNSTTTNGLFTVLTTSCQTDQTGYNSCSTQDQNLVQIQVNSGSVIYLSPAGAVPPGFEGSEFYFDVAGDCNEGGYILGAGGSKNFIRYSLYAAGVVNPITCSPGSTDAKCIAGTAGTALGDQTTCTNGRFNLAVYFPNGYIAGLDYTLNLELNVYDNNGQIIDPNLVSDRRSVIIRVAN